MQLFGSLYFIHNTKRKPGNLRGLSKDCVWVFVREDMLASVRLGGLAVQYWIFSERWIG